MRPPPPAGGLAGCSGGLSVTSPSWSRCRPRGRGFSDAAGAQPPRAPSRARLFLGSLALSAQALHQLEGAVGRVDELGAGGAALHAHELDRVREGGVVALGLEFG